ncbi:hypothetical protein [Kitasatospora sp. NPDC094015]|uniref:hypothetical protein n=1 Tax=Kitasatospora sp. NPDC094015 TaxID=3155205 RepID=UPI003320B9BA
MSPTAVAVVLTAGVPALAGAPAGSVTGRRLGRARAPVVIGAPALLRVAGRLRGGYPRPERDSTASSSSPITNSN